MTDLQIGEGTRVSLNFALSLTDGSAVDSNFEREPVQFVVGDGSLLPGFERLLFGLCAGDRRQFTLPPDQAFGQANAENVRAFPRERFAADDALEVGLVYSFADTGGGELPGVVTAVDARQVTVDFNHPLAGRSIVFEVWVHNVEPAEVH